jgi:hypothetical protein
MKDSIITPYRFLNRDHPFEFANFVTKFNLETRHATIMLMTRGTGVQ